MFQQAQFLDIIFLLILALFLIFRLRSVLGTRPESKNINEKNTPDLNVVDISDYRTVRADIENVKDFIDDTVSQEHMGTIDEGTAEVLEKIKKIDTTFSLKSFTAKASKAFEYIALAFAKGDKDSLKPLLTTELYDKFSSVIDKRNECGETVEFSLIGFDNVTVVKAELYGSIAELTVEFITEQTNLIKDADGNIVSGNPTYIESVMDIWTLRKDLKNKTPVWVLTATKQKAA